MKKDIELILSFIKSIDNKDWNNKKETLKFEFIYKELYSKLSNQSAKLFEKIHEKYTTSFFFEFDFNYDILICFLNELIRTIKLSAFI